MIVSEIKLYDFLKAKIGEREAEAFVEILERKIDKKFEDKQTEFVLERDKEKLLTKADALTIFATKEDLAKVETHIIKWLFIFLIGFFFSTCTVMFALFNIYFKH